MKAIEFEKVHFSYTENNAQTETDDVFALDTAFSLDGLDFSVEEGEFVAVLGHNGSGKSTLARLTNGLLRPQSGNVRVLGIDACNEKNFFEIRKSVQSWGQRWRWRSVYYGRYESSALSCRSRTT